MSRVLAKLAWVMSGESYVGSTGYNIGCLTTDICKHFELSDDDRLDMSTGIIAGLKEMTSPKNLHKTDNEMIFGYADEIEAYWWDNNAESCFVCDKPDWWDDEANETKEDND
jgi:hypothetical protein